MAKYIKLGVEVPEEINENEKHLYHVLIITDKKLNSATLDVNVKSKVQLFDDRSWLKHKNNMKQLGLSEVFILHDPTLKVEAKKETGSKGNSSAKNERAELIAKAKELGYTGAMNVKNEVLEKFILESKSAVGSSDSNTKVLTQEDFDENPELAEQGLKVGDKVSIEEAE